MAAVEGKHDVLLDVLHENRRRSDEDYRALDVKIDVLDAKFDAKIDALDTKVNAKIDRLMYFMLGIGGAVLVGIVSIILQLVL